MMPVRLNFSLSTLHYATIPIQYTLHCRALYQPLPGKQPFIYEIFKYFSTTYYKNVFAT
jgi:hypothetical protein